MTEGNSRAGVPLSVAGQAACGRRAFWGIVAVTDKEQKGPMAEMFVAVLTVEFALHGNDNLKAKRRVANSLKQKVRNRFNVAVAEAGTEESLTRLRLAVTSLSNNEGHLRSRMDKCVLMMEAVCPEEMTDSEVEIYALD